MSEAKKKGSQALGIHGGKPWTRPEGSSYWTKGKGARKSKPAEGGKPAGDK